MYAQIEKPKENKSRAVANSVAQKKSNGKQGFGFVDNRPEAVAQRKLQTMANNHAPQKPIQKKKNNMGLPDNLKSGIEKLSGYSMDDVTVHYNSDKPAQLQAHAYAQGTDIHLASGQEKHLPHEAWHVVQQKKAKVRPTLQIKGEVNLNDDTGLEKEADVMGAKAVQFADNSSAAKSQQLQEKKKANVSNAISESIAYVQRYFKDTNQVIQRVPHDRKFAEYLASEANQARLILGLPYMFGLRDIAFPFALTGGANLITDAAFVTAMQAARRLDVKENIRPGGSALNAAAGGLQIVVPGVGGGAPRAHLQETDDINNFLQMISGIVGGGGVLTALGGGAGLGAGQGTYMGPGENRSVVQWGMLHNEFGTYVDAQLAKGGGQIGSPPSFTNNLGVPIFGGGNWGRLHHRKLMGGGSTLYARGHLLHQDLGGPGLDYNLVPLTNAGIGGYGANNANLAMAQALEHSIKGSFLNMWGLDPPQTVTQVNYRVVANYTPRVRPHTTNLNHVATGYVTIINALQAWPAPAGVGVGGALTHQQIMAAETVSAASLAPALGTGGLPGVAPAAATLANGDIVVLDTALGPLGGLAGAGGALASAGSAINAYVTTAHAPAVPHIQSAMLSLTAHNNATAAATFYGDLAANQALWAFEDTHVPSSLALTYSYIDNGVQTNAENEVINNRLPNNIRAPYV